MAACVLLGSARLEEAAAAARLRLLPPWEELLGDDMVQARKGKPALGGICGANGANGGMYEVRDRRIGRLVDM